MIDAKMAREIAKVPAQTVRIEKDILKAAQNGECGLYVRGQISYPLHAELRDKYGYEVSYDTAKKRTWIWWGN